MGGHLAPRMSTCATGSFQRLVVCRLVALVMFVVRLMVVVRLRSSGTQDTKTWIPREGLVLLDIRQPVVIHWSTCTNTL